MPHIPASQALSRFRVVDMTQVRAGPTAARQLADWGADVIQVQMPEHMRGDDTLGGQEGSDYQYTHRNKRSMTLNCGYGRGFSVLEVLDAVISVWGADRVGLRISPLNSYNSMIDSDPVGLTTWLAGELSDADLTPKYGRLANERAPHRIIPARPHWKVEATSCYARRREGSVLTDC